MAILDRLRGVWNVLAGNDGQSPAIRSGADISHTLTGYRADVGRWKNHRERYAVLEAYRASHDLYGRLRRALTPEAGDEAGYAGYKNLRNPAYSIAELYSYKLTDETLGAYEGPEDIRALLHRVWEWSNWQDRQEIAARSYAVTGDMFLKAADEGEGEGARTFLQWIDPSCVTDFDEDDRGHISFVRLDFPQERRTEEGKLQFFTETEIWNKERGYHAVYEHDGNHETTLADLLSGEANRRINAVLVLYEELREDPPPDPNRAWTGFDFVPIVHRKLRDAGGTRGEGVYEHALDSLDEANLLASRLHGMLFPSVVWAVTRLSGPSGESLPPIRIESSADGFSTNGPTGQGELESRYLMKVAGQTLMRLPGGADLKPLVPSQDVSGHAEVLDRQVADTKERLPELRYAQLIEVGQISGRAARLYLSDAVDRIGGARRKYEDGLVRAIQMCFTLARIRSIAGFEGLPEYPDEARAFAFASRDVFPVSGLEEAEEGRTLAQTRQVYHEMGLLRLRLEEEGIEEERIERIMADAASPSAGTQTPRRSSIAAILAGTDTETGAG